MLTFYTVTGFLVMLFCVCVSLYALSAIPSALCNGELMIGVALIFVAAVVAYIAFVFGQSGYTALRLLLTV